MDRVFINGRIYTVDADFGLAEAVAVRDGRFLAVGTNEEAGAAAGSGAETIDLGGRVAVPGIVESHLHLSLLGTFLLQINAVGKTKEAVLAEIAAEAGGARAGEWVCGRGWNELTWQDTAMPTRAELDAVSPQAPTCMIRVCGHSVWVNSKALELAGIDRNKPDPVGGEICRDASGEPNGILVDTAAQMVRKLMPPLGDDKKRVAYALAQKHLLSFGITNVHDMAAMSGYDYGTIEFLKRMYEERVLSIGVASYISAYSADEAYRVGPEIGLFGGRFTARGIKFFSDGSLGARSAWMLDDYDDRPGHKGNGRYTDGELYEMVLVARTHGFQPALHAIGDAANRQALDVYERVLKKVPEPLDHRFRIEHAQILDADDLERFSKLGVIPSMQFTHCTSDKDMIGGRIGERRLGGAFAWRTLLDRGSIIPGGSDAPVEPVSPFWGMHAALTRQDRESRPAGGWRPQERTTRREALRSFTIWGAFAAFEEGAKGSVEPGKLADLAVLDRDVMTCEPEAIKDTVCTATILGGEVVYGSL